MNFMDKVKGAGSKAKIAMEVNKLKLQNGSHQKEIEKLYQTIGRSFFLHAVGRLPDGAETDDQACVAEIIRLENQIEENNKQIKAMSNEKDCVCGIAVPLDAKFCPSCGHAFPPTD